jgi:hypothetical protein
MEPLEAIQGRPAMSCVSPARPLQIAFARSNFSPAVGCALCHWPDVVLLQPTNKSPMLMILAFDVYPIPPHRLQKATTGTIKQGHPMLGRRWVA